jgi:hypothetical protein
MRTEGASDKADRPFYDKAFQLDDVASYSCRYAAHASCARSAPAPCIVRERQSAIPAQGCGAQRHIASPRIVARTTARLRVTVPHMQPSSLLSRVGEAWSIGRGKLGTTPSAARKAGTTD